MAFKTTVRFNSIQKIQGGREGANGVALAPSEKADAHPGELEPVPGSAINLHLPAGTGLVDGLEPDTDYVLTLTAIPKV